MFDDTQQNSDDQTAPVADDVTTQDAPATDDNHLDDNKSADDTPHVSDELLEIKRSALQELSPLLDQLDQEPDERFQTTMMMIQATDNQSLVAKAYEAAKEIKDDKVRAQALLDIVNEINYFSQGTHATDSAK
jgi:hypothetical protein